MADRGPASLSCTCTEYGVRSSAWISQGSPAVTPYLRPCPASRPTYGVTYTPYGAAIIGTREAAGSIVDSWQRERSGYGYGEYRQRPECRQRTACRATTSNTGSRTGYSTTHTVLGGPSHLHQDLSGPPGPSATSHRSVAFAGAGPGRMRTPANGSPRCPCCQCFAKVPRPLLIWRLCCRAPPRPWRSGPLGSGRRLILAAGWSSIRLPAQIPHSSCHLPSTTNRAPSPSDSTDSPSQMSTTGSWIC